MHVIEPAPHHGCSETGEIADHPAAERNDQTAALDLSVENCLTDLFKHAITFRRLARRNGHLSARYAGPLERR